MSDKIPNIKHTLTSEYQAFKVRPELSNINLRNGVVNAPGDFAILENVEGKKV